MSLIVPEELGIWNTIIVFKSYALVLNLGVSNGLNRELPFLLGKKYVNFAKEIAKTALFISIIAGVFSFLLISAAAFFYADAKLMQSLFVLAFIVGIGYLNMYYSTTFRTNQAFILFSKINVVLTVFELISLFFPSKLGYQGFLIRIILLEIARLTLFLSFQPFPVCPKFKTSSFLFLVKTGVPLFFSTYLLAVSDTFKRVILKHFSTFHIVGLFSPALAVYALNSLLPKTLGQYLLPKLSFGLGSGQNLAGLWNKTLKLISLNILIILPFVMLGWFVIPMVIENFYPAYTKGIFSAQLALVSALFVPFGIIINLFHSLKNWRVIYTISFVKVIIYFIFQWFFTKNNDPLKGLAYGILISDILFAIIVLLVGYSIIKSFKKNGT